MKEESLGISSSGFEYMKLLSNQNSLNEFFDIQDFLKEVVTSKTIPEFEGKNKTIQFINYGDTQLVYVLSVGKRKYTLLLGQPATEFGKVKKEYENLRKLGKANSKNVVVPIHYAKSNSNKRELYVTPYLFQARCVGVEEKEWGMWIPEPEYHFKEFSLKERNIVNSSMIAMLIKLYDNDSNLGIASCHLGGGDFVLEKGFENEEITYSNIIKRLKLIAARELLPISLEEYVDRLKMEFSKRTYYRSEDERDKNILINHKTRSPMTIEEIDRGIELGYKLRQKEIEQREK